MDRPTSGQLPGDAMDGSAGIRMHELCARLFPICRSITGEGLRTSLRIVGEHLPGLSLHEVPTGTACFDWAVPKEWNIRDAWIEDPSGRRICDFRDSNLHVVGYSRPVDLHLPLSELQEHLHSLPDQPQAIPYVTSYYKERWGFCMTHEQREGLAEGVYHVRIDSTLSDGSLTYGELVLPGSSDDEVLLSTYLCHPSMANNELSGPVVATFLAGWIASLPARRLTYRIVFLPETIGSIVYLSRHLKRLREKVVAGFVLTCLGDERAYSHLPSRRGDTLADRVARHVLKHTEPDYRAYSYLDRGSDERQYCSPGVDLPVCSVMRSKYGTYPEYHTSLDDLDLVTPAGLQGGFDAMRRIVECLELDRTFRAVLPCEPQLGRRGLYPDLSAKGSAESVRGMMNFLAYLDGTESALRIAETIGVPLWTLSGSIAALRAAGVIEEV